MNVGAHESRVFQEAQGSYIAQATGGGTASVSVTKVYQAATPVAVAAEVLTQAAERLEAMPCEALPAPAGLPPGSRMPLLRNRLFVGRETDLVNLALALKSGCTAAVGQSAAVTGLGGVGKTQLASEFVYRYGQYFSGGVFWISCADPAAIPGEIADCGRFLALHAAFTDLPLESQIGLVASAWHGDLPRLLVFDNCEDETVLETWIPRGGGCRVLLTSRREAWPPDLGVRAIALGNLARAASIELLRKHRDDLAPDNEALDAIAAELGDLPLALHLAGSYLAYYRHSVLGNPEAYLKALRESDVLAHHSMTVGGRSPTRHEQHVARTFMLSYEQLKPSDDMDVLALRTLARAAWFAPGEPIPRDLLRDSAEGDTNEAGFENGLRRLSELGLITAQRDGSLIMHRLLSAFVRSETGRGDKSARSSVEKTVLAAAEAINAGGDPRPLVPWQAQLRAVAAAAAETDPTNLESQTRAVDLLNELGRHLRTIADTAGAEHALEQALAIAKQVYGSDHPKLATLLSHLGLVLLDQSAHAPAKACFERALALEEKAHGQDDPGLAQHLNNLAGALELEGDLVGAEALFERAITIYEQAFGPYNEKVMAGLSNVGGILREQGDFSGARLRYDLALAIAERVLPADHPHLAVILNNTGLLLQDEGDLVGAKTFHERALAADERVLGPDHPSIARDLNNLGHVLDKLGDLAGAKANYTRALELEERSLGPDHPRLGTVLNNLGSVLNEQGDHAEARSTYDRALRIAERAFGESHPFTLTVLNNSALVAKNQGDLDGARAIFERTLAIEEKQQSPNIPRLFGALNNLGSVLLEQGDIAGAQAMAERALPLAEELYGPVHPNVAVALNSLGHVFHTQNNLPAAQAAYERALTIDQGAFSPDHPRIVTRLTNLGAVLRDQGDTAAAKAAFERALHISMVTLGADHPTTLLVKSRLDSAE